MRVVPVADSTPEEARWVRHTPRRVLEQDYVDRIVRSAFGSRQISTVSPLTDGFRNANFRIGLTDPAERVVLRVYEHDPALCRKEVDLFRLIGGSVPVPKIVHVEPNGLDGLHPFMLTTFVEGISVRDLRQAGDDAALAEAGYSIGHVLAAIGRFSFGKPGWLSYGPAVTAPLLAGDDPVPRFIELCLDQTNCRERLPKELRERIQRVLWNWAPRLAALDKQSQLVHSDFGHRNLLVRRIEGSWRVAAVLDWEFAISGSPLADIGHFLLRHERRSMDIIEPPFIKGYLDGGGSLPEDWRRLAALLDLTALCESLTHEQLPEGVTTELIELVRINTRGLS